MAEKLEFDILVGKNDLTKALDHTAKQAGSISNALAYGFAPAPVEETTAAVEVLNKETNSYIKTAMGVAAGQLAYNLVAQAVGFLTNSIRGSVEAFQQQEDAINKLKQAFALTGGASQSAIDGVQAFASSLEASSRFSDDAIVAQVAFVKSLGASTQASKDLVLAAANLSATIGGSLEENTDKLGKTLSGTAGRLAQYIPELKSLTTEQLKAGEAARIINEKFGGSAANDLKTYSGQMAALSNAFNNLQESLGEVIANSSAFQSVLRATKKVIDDANSSIRLNATLSDYTATGQAKVSKTSEQLAGDYEVLKNKVSSLNTELLRLQKGGDINIVGISSIKGQIAELEKVKSEIEAKLITPKASTQAPVEKKQDTFKTNEEVQAIEKRNADILALDQQLALARQNAKVEENNIAIENEYARNEAEIARVYEFEAKKSEIDAQLKSQQAAATLVGDELLAEQKRISLEKQLAIETAASKKSIALAQNESKEKKALDKDVIDTKIRNLGYLNQQTAASFALGAALAKDGSSVQFAINKAAAVAQVLIARATGVANALLLPPPAQPAAIANANIVAGLSLATIAATAIKGYAEGGIVGQQGAVAGPDNRVATVKDGEMILNASQQQKLFNMIEGGGNGGGTINLVVDGRVLATVIRDQIQSGFRLA